MTCEECGKTITGDNVDNGEQTWHPDCYEKWFKQEALSHGIPLSVIEGRAKLTDLFSKDYIDWKCKR